MITRLFGSLALGMSISICGGALIGLVGLLSNLPRILAGLGAITRSVLKASYQLYAWVIGSFQRWLPLDLLAPRPRTAASVFLSLGLGWGFPTIIGWQVAWWWLLICGLHGLIVGIAWEKMAIPSTFQLGEQWP